MRKITGQLLLIAFYLLSPAISAQENIFTAGFQYRPMIVSSFFSDPKSSTINTIDFSISQKGGYSAGMILRRGFTRQLSFETGINYTKRNFNLEIRDTAFTGRSDFTIIGYEIPVQGMIFLRMAEKIYATTAFGVSMDMYPSNVATRDTYFRHYALRHSVFQFAALANLGAEYRTEKSGYFYLGASYHLPLSYFYLASVMYEPTRDISRMKLSGTFLTLDLRYYFHEEPLKHRKKTKKDK